MKRLFFHILLLLGLCCVASLPDVRAQQPPVEATLVVTTTEDGGPGSLRDALNQVYDRTLSATITFDIPGNGPHVIVLQSELPSVELITGQYLVIDGTTQPGYTPGSIVIKGDGTQMAGAGLTIFYGSEIDIYGLVFRDFIYGIYFFSVSDFVIGDVGAGNQFQNCDYGVYTINCREGLIRGNIFGTDVGGAAKLGGFIAIALLEATSDVAVGGTETGSGNVIANHIYGIDAGNNTADTPVEMRQNSFYCNLIPVRFSGKIELGPPAIELATNRRVFGTSEPGAFVEVFTHNTTGCDTIPDCQGKTYLGTAMADSTGLWELQGNFIPATHGVTAMATMLPEADSLFGYSSLFAQCRPMVIDQSPLPEPKEILSIYDAFTPNNDGFNDTWNVEGIEVYPDNELIILNRWGNQVFYARSFTGSWDGRSSGGTILPRGTYYYVLRLQDEAGERVGVCQGSLTLIR